MMSMVMLESIRLLIGILKESYQKMKLKSLEKIKRILLKAPYQKGEFSG